MTSKFMVLALSVLLCSCASTPSDPNAEPGVGSKILHGIGAVLGGVGRGLSSTNNTNVTCYTQSDGYGNAVTHCY